MPNLIFKTILYNMFIFPMVTDKEIRAEHENHFFMVTWVVEGIYEPPIGMATSCCTKLIKCN